MTTETIVTPTHTETEALLLALPKSWSLRVNQYKRMGCDHQFEAWGYPDDDCVKKLLKGHGDTLAEAIADLMHNLDLEKDQGPELRTAYEVKAAVVKLIGEHKAAPASFRAAVDGLRVRNY